MASNVKQYFDIKFPFTSNNIEGFFIDLNKNMGDKVLSEILHVILTAKNTRLRMPDFGTDLIKYIFELNDEREWPNIRNEVFMAVSAYVPNVTMNEIRILREEGDNNTILLDLDYSVKMGVTEENNRAVVKL